MQLFHWRPGRHSADLSTLSPTLPPDPPRPGSARSPLLPPLPPTPILSAALVQLCMTLGAQRPPQSDFIHRRSSLPSGRLGVSTRSALQHARHSRPNQQALQALPPSASPHAHPAACSLPPDVAAHHARHVRHARHTRHTRVDPASPTLRLLDTSDTSDPSGSSCTGAATTGVPTRTPNGIALAARLSFWTCSSRVARLSRPSPMKTPPRLSRRPQRAQAPGPRAPQLRKPQLDLLQASPHVLLMQPSVSANSRALPPALDHRLCTRALSCQYGNAARRQTTRLWTAIQLPQPPSPRRAVRQRLALSTMGNPPPTGPDYDPGLQTRPPAPPHPSAPGPTSVLLCAGASSALYPPPPPGCRPNSSLGEPWLCSTFVSRLPRRPPRTFPSSCPELPGKLPAYPPAPVIPRSRHPPGRSMRHLMLPWLPTHPTAHSPISAFTT